MGQPLLAGGPPCWRSKREGILVGNTVLLVLLLLADVAVALANVSRWHSPIPLAVPGLRGASVTYLGAMAAVGGALVLLWLLGVADRAVIRGQLRGRDTVVRAKDEELTQLKATAYDHDQPALADMRAHLDTLSRDLRDIRVRLEKVAVIEVTRAEASRSDPDRVAPEDIEPVQPALAERRAEGATREETVPRKRTRWPF